MNLAARKHILVFALVLAIPTTALAPDWLVGWHSLSWQTVALQQNAQKLRKLYHLRESCIESDLMEKRLDFGIQELRDMRAQSNSKTAQWESNADSPQHVASDFGPVRNSALNDPNYEVGRSKTYALTEWRNQQVQKLRDRNSRYLEKIFDDAAKSGPDDSSIWEIMQAKHDELAQIIKSSDFHRCVAELDSILPIKLKKGDRE